MAGSATIDLDRSEVEADAARRMPARRPGDEIGSPVVVLSLVVLVLNDHWLKAAHPSWLTGKLSDVAGLIVAPVLIFSLLEVVARLGGRPAFDPRFAMALIASAVGTAFAAVQLLPGATDAYAHLAGQTAHLVAGLVPFVSSGGGPADVTPDPTDLLALVALALPIRLVGRRPSDGRAVRRCAEPMLDHSL